MVSPTQMRKPIRGRPAEAGESSLAISACVDGESVARVASSCASGARKLSMYKAVAAAALCTRLSLMWAETKRPKNPMPHTSAASVAQANLRSAPRLVHAAASGVRGKRGSMDTNGCIGSTPASFCEDEPAWVVRQGPRVPHKKSKRASRRGIAHDLPGGAGSRWAVARIIAMMVDQPKLKASQIGDEQADAHVDFHGCGHRKSKKPW